MFEHEKSVIYWDYILETASLFLTIYTLIERYLLIFFKDYINKCQFLFHYIPMSCTALYIPRIYFYFIVFVPCVQNASYDTTDKKYFKMTYPSDQTTRKIKLFI